MAPNETQVKQRNVGKETEEEDNRKLIAFRGEWYDVTNFIDKHPGGAEIMSHFIGKDATYEMEVNHPRDVLKGRKPVKSDKKINFVHDEFSEEMSQLHHQMKKEGWYDNSLGYYIMKSIFTLSIVPVVFAIVILKGESIFFTVVAALIMALFWQQCGLMMHDSLHSQMTQNKKQGEFWGTFWCTFCFGMSSRSWKKEHTVHHALTNVADEKLEFVDPQAHQDVWAQNSSLFHFIKPSFRPLINIQYFSFLPVVMVIGRPRLLHHGYRDETNKGVIASIIAHWIWVFALLAQFPTWKMAALFYFIASSMSGLLHLQILVNHYCKPFYDKAQRHNHSHFRAVLDSNINMVNPIWTDWLHAGLNFHIEHHCFPRMPRNKNREVSKRIKAICQRHNVHYDECTFYTAVKRTLVGMWEASQIYKTWNME